MLCISFHSAGAGFSSSNTATSSTGFNSTQQVNIETEIYSVSGLCEMETLGRVVNAYLCYWQWETGRNVKPPPLPATTDTLVWESQPVAANNMPIHPEPNLRVLDNTGHIGHSQVARHTYIIQLTYML